MPNRPRVALYRSGDTGFISSAKTVDLPAGEYLHEHSFVVAIGVSVPWRTAIARLHRLADELEFNMLPGPADFDALAADDDLPSSQSWGG